MPKRTKSYRDWQQEKLTDKVRAKQYLNSSLEESMDAFLVALGKVSKAHVMARVADQAGLKRETLYRSLSVQGNPTLDTLSSVLKAIGLRIVVETEEDASVSGASAGLPNVANQSSASRLPAMQGNLSQPYESVNPVIETTKLAPRVG